MFYFKTTNGEKLFLNVCFHTLVLEGNVEHLKREGEYFTSLRKCLFRFFTIYIQRNVCIPRNVFIQKTMTGPTILNSKWSWFLLCSKEIEKDLLAGLDIVLKMICGS